MHLYIMFVTAVCLLFLLNLTHAQAIYQTILTVWDTTPGDWGGEELMSLSFSWKQSGKYNIIKIKFKLKKKLKQSDKIQYYKNKLFI